MMIICCLVQNIIQRIWITSIIQRFCLFSQSFNVRVFLCESIAIFIKKIYFFILEIMFDNEWKQKSSISLRQIITRKKDRNGAKEKDMHNGRTDGVHNIFKNKWFVQILRSMIRNEMRKGQHWKKNHIISQKVTNSKWMLFKRIEMRARGPPPPPPNWLNDWNEKY